MVAQRPPKSITVEDSFKSCTSLTAARHILRVLAPDLLARIAEEYQVQFLANIWHQGQCKFWIRGQYTRR